jgi:tetratricopeptide (TPR) repeat protein
MSHEVVELECPGCAAAITTATKTCPQCFRPIVITTFNSISGLTPMELNKQANTYRKAMAGHPDDDKLNMSIAFCYLQLKLYDKAIPCFEKALEENFDNSEAYFYAAIALLKGKKAFVTPRPVIDKIEEYLNAAIMIEPKGIYYYFLAYIKYDHHHRKFYKTTPNYEELLTQAAANGYSDTDVDNLYNLLGVSRPDVL